MEENKEMLELLQKIEQQNEKQVTQGRIRCILVGLIAICFVIILILLWGLTPQVNGIMTRLSGVLEQMETVLSNLEDITAQLAEVDFSTMVDNVNALVSTGQTSLETTMKKLESLDVETLNQAISDLATVVERLKRVTGIFGK